MPTFRVLPFSQNDLNNALANRHASPEEVAVCNPVKYLYGYLADLGAATILVEDPYTDAGFLDDYTAYYARCFSSYGRRCKRLHFLRRALTDDSLRTLIRSRLTNEEKSALEADYLGFVVARPLPQAIIGRTVLKSYSDEGRRHFPVSRNYKVNLFGIELDVAGLAYQEQDTVLAACATVALWSAFHKTAQLFDTGIPTPAAITRSATQAEHYGRPIPQHGLRIEEMCSAVRENGLEPEVIDLRQTSDVPITSLLYSYLCMGVPAVLVVEIPDGGLHAITLTGFSLQKKSQRPQEIAGNASIPPMMGLRIDKFYGHDDQVGPNARLVIRESPEPRPVQTGSPIRLESDTWLAATGQQFLYPIAVVLPIYNKVRLTFLDLQEWITPLHKVFAYILPDPALVEWDIQLSFSNEFKKQVRNEKNLADSVRENLLSTHHPRFWWRATMRYGGFPFCDVLFDATGIARSFPVSVIIWRVDAFAEHAGTLLQDRTKLAGIQSMLRSQRYIDFLERSIKSRNRPADFLETYLAS
jgi:hypothetical protein